MDNDQSLFSLSIDPVAKDHFTEAAKWARFIAIIGFISLGLMVVLGIAFAFVLGRTMSSLDNGIGHNMGGVFGATTGITYIIVAAIYLFPLLYLFRFATAMRSALAANDSERMIVASQNLKACFRFVGILTIIGLAFMVIFLVIGIASFAVISGR